MDCVRTLALCLGTDGQQPTIAGFGRAIIPWSTSVDRAALAAAGQLLKLSSIKRMEVQFKAAIRLFFKDVHGVTTYGSAARFERDDTPA
jgi:hypothetical protein